MLWVCMRVRSKISYILKTPKQLTPVKVLFHPRQFERRRSPEGVQYEKNMLLSPVIGEVHKGKSVTKGGTKGANSHQYRKKKLIFAF